MKKILSLILALIMMLSCATMIFAEDTVLSDETPVEVDETASAYYEAVQFLVAYDIMHGKGETLGVYDDIQRYEMALFMARILTGWTEDSTWEDGTLNSSEFTDLAGTAAESYYGAISYVNQKGVIEGYGNGKFGPTDGITYQDALTMAVRALGYNDLAYPWGYIETALNLGLDDGITGVVFTDTLKREVVAQIIYNTLFATNKAGTTLAESVFDLNLAWTNIIITKTDASTGDVPAGYVAFSIFNADGTIDGETYYVEAAQLGLNDVHDDEKAWGAVYKVMFDTETNFGLNNVIAYESLELETIVNSGRLDTVVGGLPIQAFLADFDIVTKYTQKNFLNTTPEIIIADGTGALAGRTALNYYAVDWATGNIVYIDEQYETEVWCCGNGGTDEDDYSWFIPDYTVDGGSDVQFGLIAQKGDGWYIAATPENKDKTYWGDMYRCGDCQYYYHQHTINSEQYCSWFADVSFGTQIVYVEEVLWYYHPGLDAYFQITIDWQTIGGETMPVYGVVYMTAAQRAELETLLNTVNYYDYEKLMLLKETEVDAENAYASLRVFDINADDVADYGIFETYRFGIIEKATIQCRHCLGSDKHQNVAGYRVYDISNTPVGVTSVALEVKAEGVCDHGKAWISDGSEIVDGSYVIYGYAPATGELKIVKTISGTAAEDEDNYIGYGYIRAYNVANNTITIATADGDVKANYNYTALEGTIADAMLTCHKNEAGSGDGFPAIASRYLDGLFNQYVEFVMVDDRLVYLELEGASNNLIVVEKYAGIHEDGSIVVWGYEVGASSTVTELKQFRINSFNGWAKGDWYNYSWLYEAEIEAAFTRGSLYQIMSYDPAAEGYNVNIIAAAEDKSYLNGTWTELTYTDAKVGGMAVGTKAAGGAIQRKMAATDKYVFIYDIDDVEGYNAIPIVTYEGIVTNPEAYVAGYRIGNTDGTYIFYMDDDATLVGFTGAAEAGYGLVMFLEWGTNTAYDSYTGKDYLVGSTVRTAYVLDLYTSRMKEITVYPGSYVKAEFDGERGSLNDGYVDNLASGFITFDDITGCVYQTVNGVLVDDTPVDPAMIPAIFADTVKGTNIMTDALVLETGKVLAKVAGAILDWNHSIDYGYDGAQEGDYEGFAAIEINRRMTLKALGVAYHELAPYALGRKQKASVIVNALRNNGDGTVTINQVASQTGGNTLGVTSNSSYGNRGMDGIMNFFGDSANYQAYYYSMIYHSDINGSASAKNTDSLSKAVVYIYDGLGNAAADAELEGDYVTTEESLVDGFTAPRYAYPERPIMPLDRAAFGTKHANLTALPASIDNVVGWFHVDGKADVTNYAGTAVTAATVGEGMEQSKAGVFSADPNAQGCLQGGESASAFQVNWQPGTSSFSVVLWVRLQDNITNDRPLFATHECWDSTGSTKGLTLAHVDKDTLKVTIGDNGIDGERALNSDNSFDFPGNWNKGWMPIVVSWDRENDKVTVWTDFAKKPTAVFSAEVADDLDIDNVITFMNCCDGCHYKFANNARLDEIIITSDALTQADVDALAEAYGINPYR